MVDTLESVPRIGDTGPNPYTFYPYYRRRPPTPLEPSHGPYLIRESFTTDNTDNNPRTRPTKPTLSLHPTGVGRRQGSSRVTSLPSPKAKEWSNDFSSLP